MYDTGGQQSSGASQPGRSPPPPSFGWGPWGIGGGAGSVQHRGSTPTAQAGLPPLGKSQSGGGSNAGMQDPSGPGAPSPEDWLMMLKQFADEMNAPLNMDDPLVANILTGARQQALTSSEGRGIYGGYSQNVANQQYVNTAAQLQQQRRQMGQQALQSGVGASQDLAKMRYGQARDSYQDMLNNYSRQGEQNQGWGAGIGGVIGGGLGLAASFIPGLQPFAPALISGGAQAGSSIGRGIGGMAQPPPPSFSYRGYGSGRV